MKNKYYSLNQLFSHNAYLNICMSGRGTGKSFSAKRQFIKNWEKSGGLDQGVYVRRTKAELEEMKDTYWNDIKDFYPQYEFEVNGYIGYINKMPVVYFLALSTSVNKKSASFPHVTLMVFDEYVITKTSHNHYLKNEMVLLFDIIETVFRDRKKAKILLLSNSVSFVNPLFSFFDIEPNVEKRFQKFRNNLICLELFSSEIFIEEKNKTEFSQLIKDTHYYNYAVGNMTLEDNPEFIKPKPGGNYKFLCSFKSNDFQIGCWFNLKNCEVYIDEKIDHTYPFHFAVKSEDVSPGFNHIKEYRAKHYTIYEVRSAFNGGRLYYATQEIKKFFLDNVIKYL